jgi:hypothetical protein
MVLHIQGHLPTERLSIPTFSFKLLNSRSDKATL